MPTPSPRLPTPTAVCLLVAVLLGCSGTTATRVDWVEQTPSAQVVVEIYSATLPEPAACRWEALLEQAGETPLDEKLARAIPDLSMRWPLNQCGRLEQVCQATLALADHGLSSGGAIWDEFCTLARRCVRVQTEVAALNETIERWVPTPLVARTDQWEAALRRYALHLPHHAPALAEAVVRRHSLRRQAVSDRCDIAVTFGQAYVQTGIELMGDSPRTRQYLLGELARTDALSGSFLDRLTPATPAYDHLVAHHARYRAYHDDGEFPALSGSAVGLKPTRRKRAVHRDLALRLVREGFMATPVGPDPIPFDRRMSEAIKAFQAMHHLTQTGAVGPATLAALNQPLAKKLTALKRALAVYRRAVLPFETTLVLVQQPAAFVDVVISGELRRHERVVLGRLERDDEGGYPMATPVLDSTITEIIFNPIWRIPSSIARNEIEPAMAKDPGYMARHHYRREVIGKDRVRYIQLPGPHNALGQVKFHFANSHDVYLHDTPARRFFRRPRRFFSHGCVRVENAVKVAALLLNRDQGFTWDRLRRTLLSTEPVSYRLVTPIPVHLIYSTAAADGQGRLHFMPDVYGREVRASDPGNTP